MKILFDYDSLLYVATYKILSFSEIKGFYLGGKNRKWIEQKIVLESNERLANITLGIIDILWERENIEFSMTDVEYYISSNFYSYRRKICSNYKAHRKSNKWVKMLRDYLIENEQVLYSLEFEADDLIADRSIELNRDCLVCSIDKDLNQIEGWHFDLYKAKTGDIDDFGREIKEYRGLYYVSDKEAKENYFIQMLMGDASDNIKGIKGIGIARATKIIKDCPNPFYKVCRTYAQHYGNEWKTKLCEMIELIYLGTTGRRMQRIITTTLN